MQKQNCQQCQSNFSIADEDLAFFKEMSPVAQGKRYDLPLPRYCQACRQQHRMAYRNETSLYKRDCDKCKKPTLSVYSKDKPFTVWCRDCWWSDSWNGTDFAQDFDFNRPFFEQYHELMSKVPQLGIINAHDENSDYSNYGYGNKDCYLLYTSDFNEKCFYGRFVWNSFECFDNLFVVDCQLCYQCVDCVKCYASAYCRESESLTDCFGCYDCRSCGNCFGSSGLRNKEFVFFNEQLSKEEYEKRVAEARASWPQTLERFKHVGEDTPHRNLHLVQCENALGDHLKNCKNAFYCFDAQELEDSKFMTNVPAKSDHCYDVEGGGFLSWSYECISTAGNKQLFSDHHWTNGSDLTYCSFSMNSNNCFGCVGVRKGAYCILNKQYSKEEHEAQVARIIEHMYKTGEWGDCFVPRYSRYGYNETLAQDYYPLSKERALALGFKWRDTEPEEQVHAMGENVLTCEVTGKPFRLTKQELDYYKKMVLPNPSKHPEVRMKERNALRNPRQLWQRACDSCGQSMATSNPPQFTGKVYCEDCYLKTLY